MTAINRLTQIAEAADNDIIPIWDTDSSRTRGVLASTLKEYVAADEVVNAKIVDNHLILIKEDGSEIDAGLLPSSSGIDFQNDGVDIGSFSTVNFGEGIIAKPSETFGIVADVELDKSKAAGTVDGVAADDDGNIQLDAVTFKGGKVGAPNAHLDIDIERDCSIRLVTDDPAAAYEVIDAYKDDSAPDGYYAKFGSRSLTSYLTSKGDLRSSIDGVDGVVYTSQNPPPILIDDLPGIKRLTTGAGLYTLEKGEVGEVVNRAPFARTLRFDQSITLSEPYDGLTAIYATENTAVDDIFHLDIDPDDSRLNKDWVFTIAIDSDITKSTLECKIGKTNPTSFNLATGFAVLEVDSQKGEFVIHNQSSTVTGDLAAEFCDLTNEQWKNIPSKEWIVREGTLAGFGAGVDGKTARIRCQVSNSSISTTEIGLRAIEHVYTIISDDATINGRVFARSSKSKETFDAAVLREETNNTGSGEITIDGNASDKIVSGPGIDTSFDAASKTTTITATDSVQPDVAGFGTINQLPEHLIDLQIYEANVSASYDDNDFTARFSNGETGPVFNLVVQNGGHALWQFGFDHAGKITQFDKVMARILLQVDTAQSTLNAQQIFNITDLKCSVDQVKSFKYLHGDQDMIEFWVVATPTEGESRYFLEFDMSGVSVGALHAAVKVPKFVDYVIPWDLNRKPPQFVKLEEGMNNQGKMGDGANIDSGAVGQGKVYVENFSPSSGGPDVPTGEAQKGFVIKHYGFNDQDSAAVITFHNNLGDVYTKMNKNAGEKGDWKKLNNTEFANTRTFMLEATEQEFLEVDRNTPVIVTEEIDSLVLCKATDPESGADVPKVRKGTIGELASGFSICPDNTAADTQILQASSGTYPLTTMVFAVGASVDDPVYVGPDGKLTLDQSDYVVGWVLTDGVIIDIDLYNATVTTKNNLPDLSNYVQQNTRVDSDYVQVAYQGKYGIERVFHPALINQDSNGYTSLKFTGYMNFVPKDKNTGDTGSSVLELRSDKAIHKQQPYYNDKKLAVEETDVKFTKLQTQRSGRDFPPVSLYVDGYMNTIMEANGDFKFRYLDADGNSTQTLQANSSKWNFLVRPKYNNKNLTTEEDVYDVISDAIETGTGIEANSIRVAKVTGYANNYTSVTFTDDKVQGLKFGKDNALFEIVCYANSKLAYVMIHKDNVSASIGRDVDDGDLVLGVNTPSDLKISIGKYGQDLPTPVDDGVIAKIAYNFYAITMKIGDANQDANEPSQYLKSDGTTTSDASEAKRMGYSPMPLELNSSFNGRDWGYSLIRGYIKSDKTFEADIESPYYVMAVKIGTPLTLTKQHTAGLSTGSLVFYNNPLDASLDQNPLARIDDVNENESIVYQQQFKAKSGYDRVSSGGGSTHKIEYWENGTIFKLSNSKIEVHLLEGMNADSNKHGYVKYINSHNDNVTFEWYDRYGNQITNSTVPSVCPPDTVVDIFANYDTDDYFLTFGQSKAISGNELEEVVDYAIADQLSILSFDSNKVCTIDKPDSAKYDFIDSPTRLYSSADIKIILDSTKPRGALQLENKANYHGDRPEMRVAFYIDNEANSLGGLRLPYGTGCYFRYNLDNKTQQHMAKGYWTYSVHYNDYSLIASSKEAENDALMEGLASGVIYAKTVTIG